jgi:hypothetical protein
MFDSIEKPHGRLIFTINTLLAAPRILLSDLSRLFATFEPAFLRSWDIIRSANRSQSFHFLPSVLLFIVSSSFPFTFGEGSFHFTLHHDGV